MYKRTDRIAAWAIAVLLMEAAPVRAQIVISAGEDVNFKLGVLGQFQGDTIDMPGSDSNTSNLFVRRLRLLFGGQVAKNVTFFVETDAPNLGKTLPGGKNIQPSVIVQDAYAEFKFADAFALDAGLMYVPFSRNSIQSAATLLPIDYGAYTFSQSAPTQSSTGRDTGFQAKGYLLDNHLEYRLGAFQGVRDAKSSNSFRYVGRAQYNLFDTETGFFYTGTYLGKKKILAVGAAFDKQSDFHAYDADAFLARIQEREAEIVIPPLKVRNVQRRYNRRKYKPRNPIERFVNRLKHYRRVATRYEKTACDYLAVVTVTAIVLWLR